MKNIFHTFSAPAPFNLGTIPQKTTQPAVFINPIQETLLIAAFYCKKNN